MLGSLLGLFRLDFQIVDTGRAFEMAPVVDHHVSYSLFNAAILECCIPHAQTNDKSNRPPPAG